MPRQFSHLTFTPAVQAMQERMGSRQGYARFVAAGPENNSATAEIIEFIHQIDGFYFGTVTANGYPYIQFRGGRPGFLKVLDDHTLGFADFRGNQQYISVGNLAENDRAFLFLMDYRHRRRLKILGRARVIELEAQPDAAVLAQLQDPSYPATVERGILFQIEGWDWNCPQHIPRRYSEAEVAALQTRIAELEARLAAR